MDEIKKKAKALGQTCIKHRRYFHQNAETGFDVEKTTAYIWAQLQTLGYAPKRVGKNGITAEIGTGKTLLFRADIDGLPVREKTGLPFACKTGNMHACGHDMHTAILLGVAELLKGCEDKLTRKIRLLFQPAEELLLGAKDCIEHGVLDGVKGAVTLHVLTATPLPVGTVIIAEGESAPSADYFTISVKGKSCHGAVPQNGVDALAIGARILLALDSVIAKETPVSSRAVLTVGKMEGGSAGNVIAGETTLQGTLRCFGEPTRAFIKKRIEKISRSTANAFQGKARFFISSGCPYLVNDGGMVEFAMRALQRGYDKEKTVLSSALGDGEKERNGGSEDFAYIAREVPSVMLALCAGEKDKGFAYPLHHPKVDFDENALWQGVACFCALALEK